MTSGETTQNEQSSLARNALLFAMTTVTALCLIGCGGSEVETTTVAGVVPVRGRITVDGEPLAQATVWFFPVAGGVAQGEGAIGTTDSAGAYELQAINGVAQPRGAAAGKYRVLVSRLTKPDGSVYVPDPLHPPSASSVVESMPAKYSDHALTELKANVVAGGDCIIDFKLRLRP